MDFATASSTLDDPRQAVEETYDRLAGQLGGPADLLFLSSTVDYDSPELIEALGERADGTPIHGGTSCQATMTEAGIFGEDGPGMSLLGLRDAEGAFGVGVETIGDQPRRASRRALTEALEQAGRVGEVPQLIWITGEAGDEEELIAGIEELVGSGVPVMGGTAADNTVAGEWYQFANGEAYTDSVVISVLFPSKPIGFSFHSGYEPTGQAGTVTRAEGRTLFEIDGDSAAEVYNEWTDGAIDGAIESGGTVLDETTLHPLGREVASVGGMPYYQLSHPEQVTEDGALALFTRIEEGDEVVCMTGTVDSLTARAGRVAEAARDTRFGGEDELAGALVIYCAGCMLTVEDRITEVVEHLNDALDDVPFLGAFTFGEQGCFVGGNNQHANLMISVVTFYE